MSDLQQILSTIKQSVDRLGGAAAAKQDVLFKQLLSLTKRLETRGDNLLNNLNNLKLINEIKTKLERLIIDDKYKSELKSFAESYSSIQELNNQYFSQFAAAYKPMRTLGIIKKNAIESTLNGLTENGLSTGVTDGLKKILQTNISNGGSYVDLTDQLRNYMINNQTGEGALERYVRTYANTAINQFSAEYHKAIADDLGLEWYMYDGSLLETSREFCVKCVAKKYIHVSEFLALLRGDFGELGKIHVSKTTGLPNGLMAGTDSSNFIRRRGGWNCGHQMIAVDASVVPQEIKDAVYATAAYKSWAAANGKVAQLSVINEPDGKNYEQINFTSELKDKNVKVYNNVEDKMKALGYTEEDMINVVGGIFNKDFKNIDLQLKHAGTQGIKIIAESDDYHIERILHPDTKEVYNAEFFINSKRGEGNGIKAFVNQVNQLKKIGYVKMRVSAGLSASMNGAITWARFGYKMKPESVGQFQKLMSKYNRTENDLLELMSTDEGVSFWKKKAFWFEGEFDLTNGSANIVALQKYLDSKGYNYQLSQ